MKQKALSHFLGRGLFDVTSYMMRAHAMIEKKEERQR